MRIAWKSIAIVAVAAGIIVIISGVISGVRIGAIVWRALLAALFAATVAELLRRICTRVFPELMGLNPVDRPTGRRLDAETTFDPEAANDEKLFAEVYAAPGATAGPAATPPDASGATAELSATPPSESDAVETAAKSVIDEPIVDENVAAVPDRPTDRSDSFSDVTENTVFPNDGLSIDQLPLRNEELGSIDTAIQDAKPDIIEKGDPIGMARAVRTLIQSDNTAGQQK